MKTSPAANKARSDITHLDEQHKKIEAVLREIARQIAALINQKANYRMDRNLLEATAGLRFCGDIIIEQFKNAIAAAVEASSKPFADGQQIVIFVDGSLVQKPNNGSDSVAHLGAAVVYKSPEGSQDWEERRYFAISKERNAEIAEIFAISQGLAVAAELIKRLRRQNGRAPEKMAAKYKVTIFTDCQRALEQFKSLRKKSVGRTVVKTQICGNPNICKLITRSQYLRRIGVDLELCWVPGHSKVEGNDRAHQAAKLAAKVQGITSSVDEGPRWIELKVSNDK